MNKKYYKELDDYNNNCLFIVSPNLEDIQELKVEIEKEDRKIEKLLYVAQICTDSNDFYTYVLFKSENKVYVIYEYENPQHCSYHFEKSKETTVDQFFNTCEELHDFFKKIKVNLLKEKIEKRVLKNNTKSTNNTKNNKLKI